jgi:hypothetical protein
VLRVSNDNGKTFGEKIKHGRPFICFRFKWRPYLVCDADNPSDLKGIVTECRHPDGIVVDVEAGHIYWTDMGVPNLNMAPYNGLI